MKKNIESLYINADLKSLTNGLTWYRDAYLHSEILAKRYQVSIELVASVIAALSPRNRWARNLVDANNVLNHVFNNGILEKCAVYNAMRDKALTLCLTSLTHEERLTILNGRKIQSFYCNILGIDNRVTIDSWIDLLCYGKYIPVKKRRALTLLRYKKIENAFIDLSYKYKCKPYQLQAICWLAFQRQVKEKTV